MVLIVNILTNRMDLDIPAMEARWKKLWSEESIYATEIGHSEREKCFSIDTPPPTISGKMHMGHAFSYPHQDFIARYKRLRGYSVFYPWGFDDNGLPTERYTEKSLGIKGERTDLGEFIRLCMQESAKAEEELKKNWMDLGISADFSHAYRTFSEASMKISQSMFLDLVEKRRVYREEGPTIRCPTCRTAISQIDLKDINQSSEFVYVRFTGKDGGVLIATTRPELMGACVAVAVNPSDERYSGFIGKKVTVPVYGYTVDIIADDLVAMDKGTGAEMVCTFGDQNDIYLWRKHGLSTRIILDDFGKFKEEAGIIKGLTVREGRKRIIEELEHLKVVEKIERVKHSVNAHERCDTPVEFGISKQWYVKVLDIREELKASAHSAQWIPIHMRVRIDNWIDGLKWDWGISRQRFLGVPFPVWYCRKCGETVYAGKDDLPVDPRTYAGKIACPKCGSSDLDPETDVMDTWATSSLSPRLALIPEGLFPSLYPMDARFQGHDIISTWAFTTIVRSFIHDGISPWKSILISGNVYDPQGQKMSKSRGNIIEPADLVNEYGADAVRYWASTALPGEDIKVREQDFVRGKRTVIKIFNASKLVAMLSGGTATPAVPEAKHPINAGIISGLNDLIVKVTDLMDSYQFSRARSEIDNFFWNVYCDNYLEMAKGIVNRSQEIGKDTQEEFGRILRYVLLQIMKMYAPVMPFITEEVYHSLNLGPEKSIHLEKWPLPSGNISEKSGAAEFGYILQVLSAVRSFKTSKKLSMGSHIDSLTIMGDKAILERYREEVMAVMNIGSLSFQQSQEIQVREG